MVTTETIYTREEIANRAKEIYDREIRASVEPAYFGQYLVLDIESGGYEIDGDELVASLRAADRFPEGIRHGFRIGFRTTGRIGARSVRDAGQ